jgi:uncharacterized protein YndB with AHSA1/START domain
MTEIRHNVVIKASPEKIYEALTTQNGLSKWWTTQTTAEPSLGFINTFTFGNFVNKMEVATLDPNVRVEWNCVDSIEEWIGTKIHFDLQKQVDKTLLRFGHTGWKEVTDMYANCNYDWAQFLKSLKLLCETGKGTPHGS